MGNWRLTRFCSRNVDLSRYSPVAQDYWLPQCRPRQLKEIPEPHSLDHHRCISIRRNVSRNVPPCFLDTNLPIWGINPLSHLGGSSSGQANLDALISPVSSPNAPVAPYLTRHGSWNGTQPPGRENRQMHR